jgi:hypothetical protein
MVKIEELDEKIQNDLIDLKGKGLSNQDISKEINNKWFLDLSEQDIKNFAFKKKDEAIKLLHKEGKLSGEIAKKYFSTIGQLNELNKEMWDLFYKIKSDPDYSERTISCPECNRQMKIRFKNHESLMRASEVLLKQISHVDEVLGRLSKQSISVTYNFVDMAQKINKIMPDVLDKFERRGLIKKIRKKKELIIGEAV